MVVDTSALIAVLFGEAEEETFLRILLRASGACRSLGIGRFGNAHRGAAPIPGRRR